MSKMITSLTPEQEAMMPEWADKWIKIGCSTEQSSDKDFEESFQAVVELFSLSGFTSPTKFIVVDSPMGIHKIVGQNSNFVSDCSYGCLEAGWLSHYTFFRDVVGIELDPRLEKFVILAKNVSWWYIHKDTVIFSKKPIQIHMRDGVLHNDEGPAILFADNFAVWNINGSRVTEQIVMRPETLTVEQINKESDSDVQSIMIDRFGWGRYIEESNSVQIDSRRNDVENTLEALYDTAQFGRRLVCTCPTGRVFVKGIATQPDTKTCESAQQWLAGNRKFRTIART